MIHPENIIQADVQTKKRYKNCLYYIGFILLYFSAVTLLGSFVDIGLFIYKYLDNKDDFESFKKGHKIPGYYTIYPIYGTFLYVGVLFICIIYSSLKKCCKQETSVVVSP